MSDQPDPSLTGYLITNSGVRVPVNRVKNIKEAALSAIEHALLKQDPNDPKQTKLQAAIEASVDKAAAGETQELHTLLDRILGKPKQSSENLNVTANLADFLSDLEKNSPPTEEELRAAGVMDAEFSIDEADDGSI